MGCCEDVCCIPCKILQGLCDCLTVLLCCPCRCCCGFPKTSSEEPPQVVHRTVVQPVPVYSPPQVVYLKQ